MTFLKDYLNFQYETHQWSHLGKYIFSWEHVEVTWAFRACDERDEACEVKKRSSDGHLHTSYFLCLKDLSNLVGKGVS